MIEIPEAIALSEHINETLAGKRIDEVIVNQSPHKFAWSFGDPYEYDARLNDKIIRKSRAYGGLIEISLGTTILLFGDGVTLRYLIKGEKLPGKHQMLIRFDNKSILIASVQMYGGYITKLSKKTVKEACKVCDGQIIKKAYLGGSIYYCEGCQQE